MVRFIGSLSVLVMVAGLVHGEFLTGKVKSVDADKSKLTVTADGKDQTFDVAKDAKVTRLVGKKAKKAVPEDVPGGLGGLAVGTEVQVGYTKKDGKDVADSVRIPFMEKKKKGT